MIGALVRDVPARRPASAGPPGGASEEQTLAVLVGARALVARGWVQGGWYVLQAPDGRRRFVGAGSLTPRSFGEIVQSCLVGAVVEAARWHTAEKGAAGPAIDTLWRELGELAGRPRPADPWPPSPGLRTRRVAELARWNDDRTRSRDDVLHLLDVAISHLARSPEPSDPADADLIGGVQNSSASTAAARWAPSAATGR